MKKEIPKIIHYCWFGNNPKPELAIKCIESWKKYCPGYEIKEWNDGNYDLNSCNYIKEAYRAKKWAFVSDYARFDILYNNGGLYFDTDVELIKPIDDIVQNGAFMGEERPYVEDADILTELTVNPGLGLGVEAGNPFYKEILEYYKNIHFLKDNGELNEVTVVYHTTDLLKKYGLQQKPGIQNIMGINIYPKDYFCPMDYKTGELSITQNTRSIHHYHQSWLDEKDIKWHKIAQKLKRRYGLKTGEKIYRLISLPYRIKNKLRKIFGTL
ncbi:MAG: glycosyltransferase family 32 protein [Candidatus Ornithomonoglobus sp.]